MRPSSRPRKTANLSESIRQQLNLYALAASAAGVSVLALTQPSEAKIVYTPTHRVLVGMGSILLDLNHDGIRDFRLFQTFTHTSGNYQHSTLNVYAAKNTKNRVFGTGSLASALSAGANIGPLGNFPTKDNLMAKLMNPDSSYQWYGQWANGGKGVKNRYLGLKFGIKGKVHFGWARLTVNTAGHRITTTLTGYAYETIPGKSLKAGQTKGADDTTIEESNAFLTRPTPQPATLGVLAMGRR